MNENKSTILLLEDDESLGMVLQDHLQMLGYTVILCPDGEVGLEQFNKHKCDLCLVDIMMPKKDGLTFTREIRASNSDVPIIFLTAKSLKQDKIDGFKAGCDDYITKPFNIEELMLRIEAVMRRGGWQKSEQEHFTIGSFAFDYSRRVLKDDKHEQKVTPKEAELLRLLCQNINRTCLRKDILHQIWNDDGYFASRSMDVFISKLRKYFKSDPSIEIISVHGEGIRLVAE